MLHEHSCTSFVHHAKYDTVAVSLHKDVNVDIHRQVCRNKWWWQHYKENKIRGIWQRGELVPVTVCSSYVKDIFHLNFYNYWTIFSLAVPCFYPSVPTLLILSGSGSNWIKCDELLMLGHYFSWYWENAFKRPILSLWKKWKMWPKHPKWLNSIHNSNQFIKQQEVRACR